MFQAGGGLLGLLDQVAHVRETPASQRQAGQDPRHVGRRVLTGAGVQQVAHHVGHGGAATAQAHRHRVDPLGRRGGVDLFLDVEFLGAQRDRQGLEPLHAVGVGVAPNRASSGQQDQFGSHAGECGAGDTPMAGE